MSNHVAVSILNREFKADYPNGKWCTDVSEFKYGAGKKAYLSAIIDLYDGSIVSYRFGRTNNNPLVFETMKSAIQALLFHSMSRVGRCLDNASIEGFWGSLKCEMYYLSTFHTYEELEKAIAVYIHFYNTSRYQKRLNGLSPLEYSAQAA